GGRLTGSLRLLAEIRVGPLELPHLALGAPAKIAVASVAETGLRDARKVSLRVEPGSKLVDERFVVDEAVGLGGAEGPLVEVLRLERAAFQPGDLRADQSGAVGEVLRAILRPDLQLPVMAGHRLEMPAVFDGLHTIAASSMGKCGEEPVVCRAKLRGYGPEERSRLGGGIDRRRGVASEKQSLQLPDPVPARRERQTRVARQVTLELAFVEEPVVEATERPG